MNNEVENLIIYRQFVELIYYTLSVLPKYPKVERTSLCEDIKQTTYRGLECILYAYRVYDKSEKLNYLTELDIKLKFIKVLIRISYKKKYISSKNYAAWSKKLFNIGGLLGGWITSCQKN